MNEAEVAMVRDTLQALGHTYRVDPRQRDLAGVFDHLAKQLTRALEDLP